ncbi:hypothetical protein NLX86_24145 [Streptomyces sp. A3M-1-3]|uniref:hypothetical protein n=1 Tax=Streptomyces sp. A3M-1-3 TaxID=2962044 RepID=UPI0020B89DDD|nr:hypothetical protein [Streptomyces sp. A3M-1-3]MCP3821073.1 hypothetical protein [Streptomyces sp. A3M-1-3]
MPAIALLATLLVIGFEQLVEWRYGTVGIIGLFLLAVGVKAKNPTCAGIGAAVLAVQVAGPSA